MLNQIETNYDKHINKLMTIQDKQLVKQRSNRLLWENRGGTNGGTNGEWGVKMVLPKKFPLNAFIKHLFRS